MRIEAPIPTLPNLELPTEDDIPTENAWHQMQMDLLIETLLHHWRDRNDFFVGCNLSVRWDPI